MRKSGDYLEYSTVGTVFKVYSTYADALAGTEDDGVELATLTVGADHYTNTVSLETGKTYYLKEITYMEGFKVPDNEADKIIAIHPGRTDLVEEGGHILYTENVSNESIFSFGGITFRKEGPVLTGVDKSIEGDFVFEYSYVGLAGATFDVIADEDIYDAGVQVYEQGDPVLQDITPDSDGTLRLENMHYGNYRLVETSSDNQHYITDPEGIPFTIDATSAAAEVTTVVNARKTTSINAHKIKMSSTEDEEHPVSGATFGLYAAEDIYDNAGNLLITASDNVCIATQTTDENGDATFQVRAILHNLDGTTTETTDGVPYGYSWYLKEKVAPAGYSLADPEFEGEDISDQGMIHFDDTLTEVEAVYIPDITVKEREEPGSITITKKNTSNQPLQGVTYQLDYSTDDGATWDSVYYSSENGYPAGGCKSPALEGRTDGCLTTDATGTVLFSDLLADENIQYRVTEVATINGYMLLKEPVYIGTLPVQAIDTTSYDMNADGEVNDADVVLLTQYLNHESVTLAAGTGDIDGNGSITNADLTKLQDYVDDYDDPTNPYAFNRRYDIAFEVIDGHVFKLPLTGDKGFAWLPFASAGAALAVGAMTVIMAKKRRNGEV